MLAVNFPLFPDQATDLAGEVDLLFFAASVIAVFFSLLIAGMIFYFAIRYRRRRDDEVGAPIHGSTRLEIAWSVIPLIIALGLFVWGTKVFFSLSRPPADAIEYYAVGKQWMWKFQHPTGQREINNLHVPVNTTIKVTMTSEDVIHSLFVPAFRVKADALPGRYTSVWFEATKPGRYHLFCAEYCGAEHSLMGGWVYVLEPADYEQWLAGQGGQETGLASGDELFQRYSCNTCHRSDSSARAPILTNIYGKTRILKDGKSLTADDNYLRESILDPNAKVVDGYQPIMPTFKGQMSEEEVLELVQYIRSMGSSE